MKRISNLFDKVCSFENLYRSFKKAFQGSGKKDDSRAFYFYLEPELLKLKRELTEGTYQPGRYRFFKIYDPKERIISVAPFRDRVVHHAVVNILEPIYEKCFIFDSYATRKGKGTHLAVKRAQRYFRKADYYFKADVDKYFDGIDHEIMFFLIQRKIKDTGFLQLIEKIIRNNDVSKGTSTGKGLPIGNLTSQFFANVYLDPLDHYLKDELRVKYYIRYMDDFVVFGKNREFLKEIKSETKKFIGARLAIKLKTKATLINSAFNGLGFLGYRIFPHLIRLKAENVKRLKRRIKQREREFYKGRISEEKMAESVRSSIAYAEFAGTLDLRRKVFGQGAKAAPTV